MCVLFIAFDVVKKNFLGAYVGFKKFKQFIN